MPPEEQRHIMRAVSEAADLITETWSIEPHLIWSAMDAFVQEISHCTWCLPAGTYQQGCSTSMDLPASWFEADRVPVGTNSTDQGNWLSYRALRGGGRHYLLSKLAMDHQIRTFLTVCISAIDASDNAVVELPL